MEKCRREGVCNIWLDVRKANLTAQAFYASFGFETVGTRRGFYNDPIDDSLIMCLVLDRYFLLREVNIS
ncbi:GNAT family N-acetyltransferase [Leptolyngbya sp. 7M]|uniref:GNAT family N-acetyltransferase n=1 Tax=Leptolyngbya sp. 7M TaxID=2812896 RepID=UPI0039773522